MSNTISQQGRIMFIDPNDLASLEGVTFGKKNDRDNWYTSNEDLGISVDLQVFIPDRNNCGLNSTTFNNKSTKLNLKVGNSMFASILQGDMQNGKSNYMTTNYTDITYTEIATNDVSSKESFGIESIDVSLDMTFYPQVTIKFVDVHAYSLFMPAEEESKKERTYINFFKSIFHFPYPRFLLSIKGHYGSRVTFQLAVNEFKSGLNASTGNFDVTITFIGYMFGLYTDIPANLLIVAPYLGGNVPAKVDSDQWTCSSEWMNGKGDGRYTFADGSEMPTFLEFMAKYVSLADEIQKQGDAAGEGTALAETAENEAKITEINKLHSEISDFLEKPVSSDIVCVHGDKVNYYFTNLAEISGNDEKYTKYAGIEKMFTDLKGSETYSGANTIKLPVSSSAGFKHFKTTALKSGPIVANGSINENALNEISKDSVFKTTVNTMISSLSGKDHYFAITHGGVLKELNKSVSEKNGKIMSLEDDANKETVEIFENIMGFSLSVENIYRMIFAHLDILMQYFYNTISDIKQSNRKVGDYSSIKVRNTDLSKRSTSNSFLPPFFAMFDKSDSGENINKRESKYPGDYPDLSTLPEVVLVDTMIDAIINVRKAANFINTKLNSFGRNAQGAGGDVSGTTSESGAYTAECCPSSHIDILYSGKNPYSFVDNKASDGNDKYSKVLYFLKCRLRAIMSLYSGLTKSDLGKLEACTYSLVGQKGLDWNIESNWKQLLGDYEKNSGLIESKYPNDKKKLYSDDVPLFFTGDKANMAKWSSDTAFAYQIISEGAAISFKDSFNKGSEAPYTGNADSVLSTVKEKTVLFEEPFSHFLQNNVPHCNRVYKIEKDEDFAKVTFDGKTHPINKDLEGQSNYYDLQKEALGAKSSSYKGYRFPFVGKTENFFAEEHKGDNVSVAIEFLLWMFYEETDDIKRLSGWGDFVKNGIQCLPKGIALFIGGLVYSYEKKLDRGHYNNAAKLFGENKKCKMFGTLFQKWVNGEWSSMYNSLKYESNKDKYVEVDCNGSKRKLIKSGSDTELLKLALDQVYFFGSTTETTYEDHVNAHIDQFIKTMKEISSASGTTESTDTNGTNAGGNGSDGSDNLNGDDISSETKLGLYYTLKNLYDKWLCSYDLSKFRLKTPKADLEERKKHIMRNINKNDAKSNEYSSFIFVDSLYNDISQKMLLNPKKLFDMLTSHLDADFNWSVYEMMANTAQDNNMQLIAIPVYNNFYTSQGLKDMFLPHSIYDGSALDSLGFGTTYVVMYTHDVSHCLDMNESKSNRYDNDGFDLADASNTITTEAVNLFTNSINKDNGDLFYVPAFAVSYGRQNQMYFKDVTVNMDNPRITDQSIANTFLLAATNKNGVVAEPSVNAQDMFTIYSNRSYNCSVQMMGCSNIMPMMYFQLNNVPMFKGAYFITNVNHHIQNNDMTTTFSGVRVSKNTLPFTKSPFNLRAFADLVKMYHTAYSFVGGNPGGGGTSCITSNVSGTIDTNVSLKLNGSTSGEYHLCLQRYKKIGSNTLVGVIFEVATKSILCHTMEKESLVNDPAYVNLQYGIHAITPGGDKWPSKNELTRGCSKLTTSIIGGKTINYGGVSNGEPTGKAGTQTAGKNIGESNTVLRIGSANACLFHPGMDISWSTGCVLIGKECDENGRRTFSKDEYSQAKILTSTDEDVVHFRNFYTNVCNHLAAGDIVYIECVNSLGNNVPSMNSSGERAVTTCVTSTTATDGTTTTTTTDGTSTGTENTSLPSGWVRITDGEEGMKVIARYGTSDNFMGRPVKGYNATNVIVCTKELKDAILIAQKNAKSQGYSLCLYDGGRPKSAIDDFNTFKDTHKGDYSGLLASKSIHNSGRAIDLTLMKGSTIYDKNEMGSKFDGFMTGGKANKYGYYLDKDARPSKGITNYKGSKPGHLILRTIMTTKTNLKGISSEWWHFELNGSTSMNTNEFVVS